MRPWGVDYVKVDCIASHPYKADEISMIHKAIANSGRPIVLSLSPGPTALANAEAVGQNAQVWRISNDVWGPLGPQSKIRTSFPQSVKVAVRRHRPVDEVRQARQTGPTLTCSRSAALALFPDGASRAKAGSPTTNSER